MHEDVEPWAMARTATFMPKRLDSLRDRARPYVGATLDWVGLWVVDAEDGGPYVGQVAWEPADRSIFIGWVPDEDLVEPATLSDLPGGGLVFAQPPFTFDGASGVLVAPGEVAVSDPVIVNLARSGD